MQHFVRLKNLPYSTEKVKQIVHLAKYVLNKPYFYRPQIGTLIKSTQHMERLNIDFKGPLPSATQNTYFLTINDEYSRFPFVFPCPNISSQTYVNFTTCVNYSNSVYELLILKLHTPSLIVIMMYRPPSCTINEIDDVIIKINQFIFSLNLPLPNIIILGDLNFPGVDWSSQNLSSLKPPVNLCDSLFLSQQVHRPTRKSNILDYFFCPNELIKPIVISDTFISDHRIIIVETNIPVHGVAPKQIFNPPSNKFAVLDFHKADWPSILLSLQSINWATLEPIPPSSCFDYFIDTLYHKCMYHVLTKNPSKTKISKFHRERKILMRKRTKLRKMSSTKSITQLIKIEQAICDSHFKEKLNEESIAVAKIESDPKFFYYYIIIISDINKGTTSSKLVSFADDTRVYSNIEADNCDNLQYDLNSIYNWFVHNNMFFNSEKFHSFNLVHLCLLIVIIYIYVNSNMGIMIPSDYVLDLGICMSNNCCFEFHIPNLCINVQTCLVGS